MAKVILNQPPWEENVETESSDVEEESSDEQDMDNDQNIGNDQDTEDSEVKIDTQNISQYVNYYIN